MIVRIHDGDGVVAFDGVATVVITRGSNGVVSIGAAGDDIERLIAQGLLQLPEGSRQQVTTMVELGGLLT